MHKEDLRKLVITLKSSSVEISVVSLGVLPELLFSTKKTLFEKEKLSTGYFLIKTFETLERVLKENIHKITEHLQGSSDCEVIFHSPWFLPEIISKNYKGSEISLKKYFTDNVKPPKEENYQQIENKILNILVNGYQINKLRDLQCKEIEIDIFRSYISKDNFLKIKNICNKVIPQIKIFELSSSTMMCYESIKNLFISEDNINFAIIGGEITEVGIIEQDIITTTSTFPVGTHEFSRKIEKFIDTKNSLNYLGLVSDKNVDEKIDDKTFRKITTSVNEWINNLKEVFAQEKRELPNKILLFSNSDTMDFLEMTIKNNKSLDYEIILFKKDIFEGKVVNIDNSTQNNVEYLLSTYYLSIKS